MSSYRATIVYGWKGVYTTVPCFAMNGFFIFSDTIQDGGIGNVPIYGCECSIENETVIISNKELVDEAYNEIAWWYKKENIVPPILGIYPAISGNIEWHPEKLRKGIKRIP